MTHLLETSIKNLSLLLKHEATQNFCDNEKKHQQSLLEYAEIAQLLADWAKKYSPSNNWEETDRHYLTMAKVLKGAVISISRDAK